MRKVIASTNLRHEIKAPVEHENNNYIPLPDNANDGDYLTFDSEEWVATPSPVPASANDGDYLKYSVSDNKWVASALPVYDGGVSNVTT